jgi:hypothetical protein
MLYPLAFGSEQYWKTDLTWNIFRPNVKFMENALESQYLLCGRSYDQSLEMFVEISILCIMTDPLAFGSEQYWKVNLTWNIFRPNVKFMENVLESQYPFGGRSYDQFSIQILGNIKFETQINLTDPLAFGSEQYWKTNLTWNIFRLNAKFMENVLESQYPLCGRSYGLFFDIFTQNV